MGFNLTEDWNSYILYDIADYFNGRAFKMKEFSSKGLPVIKIAELNRGITHQTKYFDGVLDERHQIQDKDLLFAWSGSIGIYQWNRGNAALNQHIFKVVAKNGIDQTFLRYLLEFNLPIFQAIAADKATTMGHVRITDLKRLEVQLPSSLEEQQKIASILSALDDKIELNNKVDRTLEEMAQAIFKHWFVDFEFPNEDGKPYRSSGGTMVYSEELGKEIPNGWEVKPIGKACKVVGGGTPSTKIAEYWDGGTIHWTAPKDLTMISSPALLDTSRKITEAGLAKISSGLLPINTVLLSSRAPIGYLAIAKVPLTVNQGYIAMIPTGKLSSLFLFYWTMENMEKIKARSGGTTFGEISKREFRPIPVAIPPSEIINQFDNIVGPLFEEITNNERESKNLYQLRDTLLPKVLSGETRVNIGQNEKVEA